MNSWLMCLQPYSIEILQTMEIGGQRIQGLRIVNPLARNSSCWDNNEACVFTSKESLNLLIETTTSPLEVLGPSGCNRKSRLWLYAPGQCVCGCVCVAFLRKSWLLGEHYVSSDFRNLSDCGLDRSTCYLCYVDYIQ